MRHLPTLIATAALALTPAACGDGQSPCEAAATALCDAACNCSTDGKCRYVLGSTGNVTISFESRSNCLALYRDVGCSGTSPPAVDYGACEAAVTAAACVPSTDADQQGVAMPPVCTLVQR